MLLSIKAAIITILLIFSTATVLVQGVVVPSSGFYISTISRTVANFKIPPFGTDCTGPDNIHALKFQYIMSKDSSGYSTSSAQHASCLGFLQDLQMGSKGRAESKSPVRVHDNGACSRDSKCCVFWTSTEVNRDHVTSDDLVAPLSFIIGRGSSYGQTAGMIERYRLDGVCTDIYVGVP